MAISVCFLIYLTSPTILLDMKRGELIANTLNMTESVFDSWTFQVL